MLLPVLPAAVRLPGTSVLLLVTPPGLPHEHLHTGDKMQQCVCQRLGRIQDTKDGAAAQSVFQLLGSARAAPAIAQLAGHHICMSPDVSRTVSPSSEQITRPCTLPKTHLIGWPAVQQTCTSPQFVTRAPCTAARPAH